MNYSYGDTLLKISNVSLKYGDKLILRDINAEVKDIIVPGEVRGQVIGFLGPSGSGKTSLFRLIAGLNSPTIGQITTFGGQPVHAGEIGVVAQSYPLFEHRTVMSNLMLAARRKEVNEKLCKEQIDYYANAFEFSNVLSSYPANLSGGQRQRVAIIQQILCSSKYLLMDEPFSGLDMIMLEKTSELIHQIANHDDLMTIIVVSHDITTTAAVSDHIWLMGFERDAQGQRIPGAKIIETYDLISKDISYRPGIMTDPVFVDTVMEIKKRFRTLA